LQLILLGVSGLLLIEGGSRWIGPQLPSWGGNDAAAVVMTGHPRRLWYMREGVKNNAGESAYINELGLRGEVPMDPRPDNYERILVLGDSSYFGFGVSDNDTLHPLLEKRLADRGISSEVINAAVPGYSVAQHMLLMEDFGWDLDSTLIVISNLWSDSNFDAFADEDLLRSRRFAEYNPLAHSAFIRLVGSALTNWLVGEGHRLVTWSSRDDWPDASVRRVALDRYVELMDELARGAAERGAGVIFLSPSNLEMATGTWDDRWTAYFDAQQALAEHHGSPLVSLKEPFMDSALATDNSADHLYIDHMHPTVLGHRMIAEELDDALAAAGWPGNRLLAKSDPFDTSDLFDDFAEDPNREKIDGTNSAQKGLFKGTISDIGIGQPPPRVGQKISAAPTTPISSSASESPDTPPAGTRPDGR